MYPSGIHFPWDYWGSVKLNWAAGVSSLSIVLHVFGEPAFVPCRASLAKCVLVFFIVPDQKSRQPSSHSKMLLFSRAASTDDGTNEAGGFVPERRCACWMCGFNGGNSIWSKQGWNAVTRDGLLGHQTSTGNDRKHLYFGSTGKVIDPNCSSPNRLQN